jgi:tetratricopeptide (TPR) repeat protein
LPPLREIARMLEAGHFVRAIATVNRGGARIPADYALLRARALAGAGYADQAFEALAHLSSAPLIAPEVRAGSARLFVELGEPAKGLDQAIEALRQDPDTPTMRLTYALCAVRCARRQPDESLLVKAERALESFAGRAGPDGLLARGLEASIHAGLGEADRAITIAEQTLAADPASVDALAALVESYARITRDEDARRHLKRLADLAPDEAEALLIRLPQLRDRTSGSERPPRVEAVWDPSEVALLDGKRSVAVEAVEKLCEDYVGRMSKSASQSGLTAMATVASTCLTRAPVLSSFAPYDLSLYSVERVEAALGVLYGKDPRPRLRTDESGLRLLVGSYIGEAIRLARGGRWEGRVSELQRARVVVGDEYWYPFQAVSARLHSGGRSRLADGLRGALALRGSPPWNSYIPNPVIPPVPWGRDTWPRPADMTRLGRAVMRSPISEFCEQQGHGHLDLSLSSMGGIDAYLQLLSPVTAPRHEDAAWARRVAVFVGGYLGEVLLDLLGGRWAAHTVAGGPADFVAVLPDAFEARPVEWAYQRLTGDHGDSATDYVRTTARRVSSGSA